MKNKTKLCLFTSEESPIIWLYFHGHTKPENIKSERNHYCTLGTCSKEYAVGKICIRPNEEKFNIVRTSVVIKINDDDAQPNVSAQTNVAAKPKVKLDI